MAHRCLAVKGSLEVVAEETCQRVPRARMTGRTCLEASIRDLMAHRRLAVKGNIEVVAEETCQRVPRARMTGRTFLEASIRDLMAHRHLAAKGSLEVVAKVGDAEQDMEWDATKMADVEAGFSATTVSSGATISRPPVQGRQRKCQS